MEDLEQYEIVYVSCGAFHTLAVTGLGTVYAFGQSKYGKLGINKKDKEGIVMVPEKINFYRFSSDSTDISLDKSEAILVSAGYNHSMALSRSGKVYTWGYNGKGILGRPRG